MIWSVIEEHGSIYKKSCDLLKQEQQKRLLIEQKSLSIIFLQRNAITSKWYLFGLPP